MPRTLITKSDGTPAFITEGESAVFTGTLYDHEDPANALDKASILTLVMTLVNGSNEVVINSRNAQNVLDANGGSVATDGTVTIILQPADNPIVVGATNGYEAHYLLLQWTWQNSGGTTLTGRHTWELRVEPAP